ncbi:hypothetical protein [Xanthomonas phage vB_XooS_NR08]|nr:hypothetical protein [Xanthomonas phage vB_XooS_NR08]
MFADAAGAKCLTEYKIEGVELYGVKVFTVADVALYNPDLGRLVIGDYKFGRSPVGVGTATDPNPQCAGAAVLLAHRLPTPPTDVQLFVYQPRTMVGEPFQALTGLSERWVTFPVLLLPRVLCNRSDHIDIPSTQHRSSKGSRTTHQSTKAS